MPRYTPVLSVAQPRPEEYASHPPDPLKFQPALCAEAGVIGVLPGVIGTLQANETIKVLTGLGETLSGSLLTFNALSATTRKLTLCKRT
jgi:adenylyltransferase/sulfurtransferase